MRDPMVIGEAGQRIARSVRRLREQQKLSRAEVSAKLTELGRPIPVLSIMRIEKGERRVDIDDLVALAEVLRVPADRLAFDDDITVEVQVVIGMPERAECVAV